MNIAASVELRRLAGLTLNDYNLVSAFSRKKNAAKPAKKRVHTKLALVTTRKERRTARRVRRTTTTRKLTRFLGFPLQTGSASFQVSA